MKVKDFQAIFDHYEDKDAEIVVFFFERDEFETGDNEEVSVELWNKVIEKFDGASADSEIIETLQSLIWDLEKETVQDSD